MRKRGDQKGLDTPVVHAVNDDLSMNSKILTSPKESLHLFWLGTLVPSQRAQEKSFWRSVLPFVLANALNGPPEEYGRKTKTQRNRRGLTQVVEHVV